MSDEAPTPPPASKPKKPATAKRKGAGPRPFPAYSLEESLPIPAAIKQFNAGKPWKVEDIAAALSTSPKGNKFYYLTASARDYGPTIGTREAERIELDVIGRQIVYAKSGDEEIEGYKKAFLNIPLFKRVFDYYEGKALPEIAYLKNTLTTEFGLEEAHHDDFYALYQKNLDFLIAKSALPKTVPAVVKTGDQSSGDAIVVGSPESGSKLVAFVAMPFSEKSGVYSPGFFDEVIRHLITPAAVAAGFRVETAKKRGSDVIHATIIRDLMAADLVIADLTEHNPNVLFELGWRMAIDKPIALIRALGTKPVFDVDHVLRVFDYSSNLWKSTIDKDVGPLADHLKGAWANRDSNASYAKLLIDKAG